MSTKEHFRHIMLFYYRKGKNAAKTCETICAVYGADAVSDSTCRKWFRRFRKGNFEVKDASRAGRPVTTDVENIRSLVDSDRHLTTREIGDTLNISAITVSRHLRNLGLIKKLDTWEPMETADFKEEPSDLDSEEENSRQHPVETVQIKEEPAFMIPEEGFADVEKLNDSALIKFEENLIVKLKQLSKVEAVKLMLEIQELVTQARLKHLQTVEEDRPDYVHEHNDFVSNGLAQTSLGGSVHMGCVRQDVNSQLIDLKDDLSAFMDTLSKTNNIKLMLKIQQMITHAKLRHFENKN